MKDLWLAVCLLTSLISYSQPSSDLSITTDIIYYQGPDYDSANHKLNLIIPKDAYNPPLLVWIGGGAWSKVSRQVEMDLAQKLAEHGIAVATLGHRLSAATWEDATLLPAAKHPEHAIDVARALKFLVENAAKYQFSLDKVFIGGFSSGAHLAALIAMDGSYLSQQGLPKDLIKGVIPISGTFDIPHYHQILTEGMGTDFANRHIGSVFGLSEEEMVNASPSSYLQDFDTPMLLISDRDMLRYHTCFEEKLWGADIRKVQSINLLKYGHGDLWRHFSNAENSQYRELVIDFIKQDEIYQQLQ